MVIYINVTVECLADVPVLFACLVLVHISDDKSITKHSEWIMYCALYLMSNQRENIARFISVIT